MSQQANSMSHKSVEMNGLKLLLAQEDVTESP